MFDASEAAFNDTTSLIQKSVIESEVVCDMGVVRFGNELILNNQLHQNAP